MKELLSNVSPKGQVTIPVEIRRMLGVKPKDKVAFSVEQGRVEIKAAVSPLDESYQAIPALSPPRSWKEIEALAGIVRVASVAEGAIKKCFPEDEGAIVRVVPGLSLADELLADANLFRAHHLAHCASGLRLIVELDQDRKLWDGQVGAGQYIAARAVSMQQRDDLFQPMQVAVVFVGDMGLEADGRNLAIELAFADLRIEVPVRIRWSRLALVLPH